MTDSRTQLLIEYHSSRELEVTVTATPNALRQLASYLADAVAALPSPLETKQDIYLTGFDIADASGNARETYFSFRADPSLDWLRTRQRHKSRRDWLAVGFVGVVVILALIGLRTVWHWIS